MKSGEVEQRRERREERKRGERRGERGGRRRGGKEERRYSISERREEGDETLPFDCSKAQIYLAGSK